MGPSTRNASLAEMCILVKLAATNASASLHRHIKIASSIIAGIARKGSSRENFSISLVEMYERASTARTAAEDEEHRDVHEVVQCRRGDIPQSHGERRLGRGESVIGVEDIFPGGLSCRKGRGRWRRGQRRQESIAVLPVLKVNTSAVMQAVTNPSPTRNPTTSGAILWL